MLEVAATWPRNIFLEFALPLPFTFKKTRKIVSFFLPFPSRQQVPFPYIWMIAYLLCNKYSSFFLVLFNFDCSCWLCFLLVFLLLIILHHSFFFSWIVSSCFVFLLSFFFIVLHVFLFLFFVVSSSCLCSFCCVSFFDSPMFFLSYFLCPLFSLRISFDCFCFVFVFILVPPLPHLLCFFFPGPRVRLKRKSMQKTTIWFCLPLGDLAKISFAQNNCFFWWVGGFLLSTDHVFVRCSWNMFWGNKGLLVAFYFLFIVVSLFWCLVKGLFSVQVVFLFLHFLDSFCFVFVFFFLGGGGASDSFEFCWVLFLCFVYFLHLGFLFLRRWVVVLVF